MCCSLFATMDVLDKDFEQFFLSLKKENFSNREIENICKPLLDCQRRKCWKNRSVIVLSLAIIYALVVWCDCFNWLLSVLYRILLIQLLPYWNWPVLYNAKCLIDRPVKNNNRQSTITTSANYETDKGNCLLCDNIDYIPTVANTTFSILENNYIESGLPVVITDSHVVESPSELFHTIFDKSIDFLQSSHCDVSTNLIIKKIFDAEVVLRKAWRLLDTSEHFFIQLRNCQSSAVKSSRIFIKRPYYYPLHLEPFYSSWLIVSQNFRHRQYQELLLQGLIIIQQLYGSVELRLIPKKPCAEECPIINIQLREGEAFVFTTDMWILHYKDIELYNQSITTIMEIDWSV